MKHCAISPQRVRMAGLTLITSLLIPNVVCGQHRVAAYYPSWLRNALPANQIKFDKITHINHAFAWPLADGAITGYENLDHPELIAATHQANKNILISLGGFGQSDGFAPMAADSAARKKFVENLVNYCIDGGYDGADIDWEFPQTTADRANLTTLIKEIREGFNDNNPGLLLTMVAVPGDFNGHWHDYPALAAYVDWFNLMTYDFHGPWFSHAGHNAPLFQPPNDFDGSVDTGLKYLNRTRGIPKEKINLGLPFYGREFNSAVLYGPSTGGNDLPYNAIAPNLAAGWQYHWDDISKVPYLTNPTNSKLTTFDDSLSITMKCDYAKQNGLAGVMIWALGYDIIGDRQPLLSAVARAMGGTTSVSEQPRMIAKNFLLFNNYPNPFNPTTTITFYIETDTPVKLSIYDITGKLVTVLLNTTALRGINKTTWDATGFANGLYFYKLESANFSEVKKMILIK